MSSEKNHHSHTIAPQEAWVPEWAKKVVWYQIFPERFLNGDPNNDPTLSDIKGAYPHDYTSPWQIHPWTSDWYELQSYEQQNGQDIWFNLERRRYGGDLEGIREKLDYLSDLGISAIYLNPVFEAPSYHKYDGATYHHIDPNFGPDPKGDRKLIATEIPEYPSTWVWTSADKLALELIDEVHKRGMRIIVDGVFNHMGQNSWAFQDVKKNQEKSKYKEWFRIKSWDNPGKNTTFAYESWSGFPELPELREDENGIVEGPKQYIYSITRRWMDPNGDGNPDDGIDGWRLDVAFCISHPFWKDWRKLVKSINPEAYLVAEVFGSIDVLKPYLQGDEFDAVMNYNVAFAFVEHFIEEKNPITISEFDRQLRELQESVSEGVAYVMQNLFGSHDANRIGSHIVNRHIEAPPFRNWLEYFYNSKASNPDYDTRKPTPEELRLHKLFVIFQMTYLGAPMIYYGDEAGMWGANDPGNRKPMVWDDMSYEPEVYLPEGSKRETPDAVAFNWDLFNHYKKLIQIRNENPALQLGDYQTLLTDEQKQVYAFSRTHENQTVVVVINNSYSQQNVQIDFHRKGNLKDILNGDCIVNLNQGKIDINVEPMWSSILVGV
ncbi:MAG: glycoside hydrolase family 13 protein [Xenococcaceae cyanobacterium]